MILISLLLLACSSSEDPQLAPIRRAMDHTDRAEALLAAGDAPHAAKEFERALALVPRDPIVGAWLAQARAREGKLDVAIALLDDVLEVRPDFAEARYNRAAYLARSGQPVASGAELERALRLGARAPRDVLDDPDFAPHLGHPAFAFLPRTALSVAIEHDPGPVFWGSEILLSMRVHGASDGPIVVQRGCAKGPVRLVRVSSDVADTTDGPSRIVKYVLRVEGAGRLTVERCSVHVGERGAEFRGFEMELMAPPDRPSVPDQDIDLSTPSQLFALMPGDARMVRDGGDVLLRVRPGERFDTTPRTEGDEKIAYQQRKRATLEETVWRLRGVEAGRSISVFEGPGEPTLRLKAP